MQHTKHNTTLILYPPGGYGTFIHWILDSITSKSSTSDTPYLDDGSSHKFKGTFLKFSDILNYVETNKIYSVAISLFDMKNVRISRI